MPPIEASPEPFEASHSPEAYDARLRASRPLILTFIGGTTTLMGALDIVTWPIACAVAVVALVGIVLLRRRRLSDRAIKLRLDADGLQDLQTGLVVPWTRVRRLRDAASYGAHPLPRLLVNVDDVAAVLASNTTRARRRHSGFFAAHHQIRDEADFVVFLIDIDASPEEVRKRAERWASTVQADGLPVAA